MLDRKLRRDLWRLKGQVATIALVLACGIMAMIMLRSTYQSLLAARAAYYADFRFADVFARVERAPQVVATRLEQLSGVALVEHRLAEDVMLPLDDEPDPIPGRLLSLPDDGIPRLNALYVRRGRLPMPGADAEIVLLEQFAEAHAIAPGDRLPVVINGRQRELHVVGIVLSPEFVLAMSGRELVPDNRRFAVLWIARSALASAFDMEGAFNDVALRLEPGASIPAVLHAVDRELAPYGGFHAIARDKQLSNWSLSSELDQLRTLAVVIPAIFLGVAAFLVNVVVSRLVYLERTQIAVLKALGLSDLRIVVHYLALVSLIVGVAGIAGVAAGAQTARWMAELYMDFYRFPARFLELSPTVIATALAIGGAAAIAGALASVLRIARMPPAQAMRPPAPLAYRRTLLERLGLRRLVGAQALMVVREIERKPLRFATSALGIAMGLGIFVMGRFSWDSFDRLMSDQFVRAHREDLTVSFAQPLPWRAVYELNALDGVELAEGQRIVPVRLRAAHRWRDLTITGIRLPSELRQLFDRERVLDVPEEGLAITDKLAELLGLRVGDFVEVEILERDRPTRRLPITRLVAEPFGLQAYASATWLDGVLREEPRVSIVLLRVQPERIAGVRAQLKRLPAVIGVSSTEHAIRRYREQTGGTMLVMTLILTLSAAAICAGVVYNNARVAVSMRSRDLASMRVLGFTRREISAILLGELGAQVVAGIPLGLLLGRWWAGLLATTMDPEAIRFPLYIAPRTYAAAVAIALVAAFASALLVRRKLDDLDLIGVLKAE